MPRKETLGAITPNRYYSLEAKLKYVHEAEGCTTAIIEQENIQRKIKFPLVGMELQEGAQYAFDKCFYSRNGWLTLKDMEKLKQLQPRQIQSIPLAVVYEKRFQLNANYLSTLLQVIQVQPSETKIKGEEELRLTRFRGWADDSLVDVTLWNIELPVNAVGQWVLLDGVRLKLLTSQSIVLTSTVYTKISPIEQVPGGQYDPTIEYTSLSKVYQERSIVEMHQELQASKKAYSIVSGKVSEVNIFPYEGCSVCRKKLEGELCMGCPHGRKEKFWVCQMLLVDESGEAVVFVFDNRIQGAMRLARKGSTLLGKVKSTIREEGQEVLQSHILTDLHSIHY